MKFTLKNYLLAIAVLFLISSEVFAQFSLSGEFRPRTEYRRGFKAPADSLQHHALFTDQRTRLNLDYKAKSYTTKLVVQDIRTWGSQSQLNITDGLTSVHEAWVDASLSEKVSFKFGRQEIVYDDHRIFGNVGWAQQARSHDAGIIKYKTEKMKLHLGFAYNQDKAQLKTTVYSIPGSYKALQYLWYHNDFSENLGLSLLVLNNGVQGSTTDTAGNTTYTDDYTQTYGTRITYKKDKLFVNAAAYYQNRLSAPKAAKVGALLGSVELGYKLTDKLTAIAGVEYQSGNSQTDTTGSYAETNHAFTPYYGTNHKFNGLMDYFYVGNHMNSVGLMDIYAKLKYKTEKYYLGAALHLFSAAADVRDMTNTTSISAMSSSLGTEIDLSGGFNLAEGVALSAGFSMMMVTETMIAIKGGHKDELNTWGYVMLTVKPKFISGN